MKQAERSWRSPPIPKREHKSHLGLLEGGPERVTLLVGAGTGAGAVGAAAAGGASWDVGTGVVVVTVGRAPALDFSSSARATTSSHRKGRRAVTATVYFMCRREAANVGEKCLSNECNNARPL